MIVTVNTILGRGGYSSWPAGKDKVPVLGLHSLFPDLPTMEVLRTCKATECYWGPMEEFVRASFRYSVGARAVGRLVTSLEDEKAPESYVKERLIHHFNESKGRDKLEALSGLRVPQVKLASSCKDS